MNAVLLLALMLGGEMSITKTVTVEAKVDSVSGASYQWYVDPPGSRMPADGPVCKLTMPSKGKIAIQCFVVDWKNRKTERYYRVVDSGIDPGPQPGPGPEPDPDPDPEPEPDPDPEPEPEPGPAPDLDSEFGFKEPAYKDAKGMPKAEALKIAKVFTDIGMEISRDGSIVNTPMTVKQSAEKLVSRLKATGLAAKWSKWYSLFANRFNGASVNRILKAAAIYKEVGEGLEAYGSTTFDFKTIQGPAPRGIRWGSEVLQ